MSFSIKSVMIRYFVIWLSVGSCPRRWARASVLRITLSMLRLIDARCLMNTIVARLA